MNEAFFTLHSDLPREGPGAAEDVAWAMGLARTPGNARICDAGCGPGGDVAALLAAAPDGQLVAIDAHAPFIDALNARFVSDHRVTGVAGDFSTLTDPFDLIWCAGALYFLGVTEGLAAWKPTLSATGAIAFSYPCHFVDSPSQTALAFWEGMEFTGWDGLHAQIRSAGFRVLGHRPVSDAAWEAYYGPMEARIASLAPTAEGDAELAAALAEGRTEAATWRAVKRETGYMLCVVVPDER
ncbi:class I SAM-dependent methyltransferase [Pseudoruegeria sp. SHC-113]|uniref:class I SAM-dependent methyltransferase n=1 Tax=Pseudoruegeria sp. SHC-113 TaxID=2855439 RepID=UPI0021BA954D|nr:class I SAM-dependent methyltransferase [Pseudoruegeria sp. SHC-113]MCT8160591.1 class I SAM-dependent methyltransferase [Pseudoruegeria sp. SHC-113]